MSIQINEVKDLISQFDGSSLREFSYATNEFTLAFSKNNGTTTPSSATPLVATEVMPTQSAEVSIPVTVSAPEVSPAAIAEGDVVTSPLVGVAYLKPAPDKSDFIAVGDTVKKGDPLGYFLFGGSDYMMIFEKGVKLDITIPKTDGEYYDHVLMGEKYGKLTKE